MSRHALPREVSLSLDVGSPAPGLVGLVEAAGVALRLLGEDVTDDELLAVSSAAFCNYVFHPDFNQHEEPPREFSVLGEFFSNYGPWESISYYTGAELKDLTDIDDTELAKLVAFELSHGRPVVTLDEKLRPALVTGYAISTDQRLARLHDGTDLDIDEGARWQGDHEVFRNWILLVRPGEPEPWAASRTRQRIGVLRWSVEHAHNSREFFQETRENYAPGLSGLQRFREFLDGLTDPAGVEYAENYVAAFRRAREAAAAALRDWAPGVADELGDAEVERQLLGAASSYERVVEAIDAADTLVDAMTGAVDAESEAIAALRRGAAAFPSAFEA